MTPSSQGLEHARYPGRFTLGDGMTALAPLTDRLKSLESEYQMETNRLRNEGELQG
jgi:hypothetical protein